MSIGFSTSIEQGAGVGQGYYSAVDPLGTTGLVSLVVFTGSPTGRLVITRYALPPFQVDVLPGTQYSVTISNIQTIGVLNTGASTLTGFLSASFPE